MENIVRAWVRMPSEKRLDFLDPTPFDGDDADLALGLGFTYSWYTDATEVSSPKRDL